MHSVKNLTLLLVVLALSVATGTTATSAPEMPTRRLRVQHNGEDHSQPDTANEALQAVKPNMGASTTSTTVATTPGTASNSIQINPGSIATNVFVTPGSAPAAVATGSSPASAPVSVGAPVAAPIAAPAAAPIAAAPVAQPASPISGGLTFGGLNPITMVATLAHGIHGALLGHTNTLPSSYMQSHPGGPSHH